jgi:hypothetical protein
VFDAAVKKVNIKNYTGCTTKSCVLSYPTYILEPSLIFLGTFSTSLMMKSWTLLPSLGCRLPVYKWVVGPNENSGSCALMF